MNLFKTNPRIGQELLDVPMGDMIKDMAFAIAEAQMRLDENSIEVAELMGGLSSVTEDVDVGGGVIEERTTFEDSRVFFGQQRISINEAVTIYNSTTDEALKSQIFEDSSKNEDIFVEDPAAPGTIKLLASPPVNEILVPQRLSMLELGFSPTFYQFVDTVIQCAITIKFTREASTSLDVSRTNTSTSKNRNLRFGFRRGLGTSKNTNVTTSQVNANYSQKYSYSAEGSSLLRTKLVPIPPPAILEERIQQQMEIARS